jgi:diguanylate cyclase (GGDEF)-like protein
VTGRAAAAATNLSHEPPPILPIPAALACLPDLDACARGGGVNAAGPVQAVAARTSRRRLTQVTATALVAVGASAFVSLGTGRLGTVAVLAVVAGLLLLTLGVALRGPASLAVGLLLGTLTGMVGVLAWRGAGLYDPAMLALPGLLIFSVMLGQRALFAGLLAGMLALTGLLLVAQWLGWREFQLPLRGDTLLHVWGILLGTGFGIWLMAEDLRRAVTALQDENRRVHESRAQLEHLASHDRLTGLPNRLLARDRFDHAVAQARRSRSSCAAMYLDLDQFKNVNESLGHAAGDQLLQQVGRRLQGVLRATDTVCRLGGDEFLLILPDVGGAEAAARIASTVVDALGQPFEVEGLEIVTGASVGIALGPDDGSEFDRVLKNVDIAMYRAKALGGRDFRFFDPAMNDGVLAHTQLLAGLQHALARGEFSLHWQPQIDLASGRVIGAEALLRWRHPELGAVPPARFIPVAERSGLIAEIGAWVLHEACRQAAAWRRDGVADLVVSVNLSSVQLRRGHVEQTVLHALEASGLPPERLELELTESMIVDDAQHVTDALQHLVAMGLRLSIDDFGTGYSNLGYLKRFEVGRLKIDQSFVRRLTQDHHDRAIVGAIVQMARSLGLVAIAEGVEDAATLDCLRGLGCAEGQGYHWARPMPAAEFAAWIAARSTAAATPAILALTQQTPA